MFHLNTHSLENLAPSRIGSDLLSLILPRAGALLCAVSVKQIDEQDTNYFGMT